MLVLSAGENHLAGLVHVLIWQIPAGLTGPLVLVDSSCFMSLGWAWAMAVGGWRDVCRACPEREC